MTDDDMFEHMDTILGEKMVKGGRHTKVESADLSNPDSKPSAIWELLDVFGGSIEISAKELKLWNVEP